MKHFDTLPEFLDQFKDADAVAFNWRIYGHGHTVLRPKKAVVESFLRHSLPTFGANELIKSFFRPENHTGKYITPHWIEDIDPNRYFKPNNTKVTRIGSSQDVDWSDAFVMHYICRSMEHFTQRVKVRPDTSGCWGGYNTIDLEDKEPLRLMPKVNEIMASIYEQQFKDAIDLIRGVGVEKKSLLDIIKKWKGHYPAQSPRVMRLKTCHGTALYHDEDGMVVNAIEEHGIHSGLGIVDAYIYPSTPNIITLRSRNNPNLRLKFIDYVPNHNGLMLKITKSRDAKITLSRLYRQANYYACFLPPNPLRGGIEANCLEAKGFEQIALEYLYDDNTILEPSLPFVFGNDTTLEEVTGWVSSSSGDIRDQFLRVMLSVSVSVRNHMCEHIVPGLLWPFI